MAHKAYTYKSARRSWMLSGHKATGPISLLRHNLDGEIDPVRTLNKHTNQSEEYWVSRGYYVPCYGISQTTPESKRSAVLDQKKRMFYFAERGIDVVDSYADIMEDYHEWKDDAMWQHHAPEDRRVLGALVVGAMVNRTARIEQAILMRNAGGLGLSDTVSGTGNLSDKDIEALKGELKQYANILITTDADIVHCVHRDTHRADHDGLLVDIIRETFKAYVQKQDMTVRNTVDKIGDAMAAIDEARDNTVRILDKFDKQPGVRDFMRSHAPHLREQLMDYFDTCRARTGIKSADARYSEIYMEFSSMGNMLFNSLRALRREALEYEGRSKKLLIVGLRNIMNGAELAGEMAEARYPMNALAFPGVARSEREPTSVERLVESTDKLLHPHGRIER